MSLGANGKEAAEIVGVITFLELSSEGAGRGSGGWRRFFIYFKVIKVPGELKAR